MRPRTLAFKLLLGQAVRYNVWPGDEWQVLRDFGRGMPKREGAGRDVYQGKPWERVGIGWQQGRTGWDRAPWAETAAHKGTGQESTSPQRPRVSGLEGWEEAWREGRAVHTGVLCALKKNWDFIQKVTGSHQPTY